MRTIKFRVWDKKDKKWLEYGFLGFDGELLMDNVGGGLETHEKIKDCVIQSFIGLKDKNGKEIYEGDIVQTQGVDNWEVIFRKGCFCYKTGERQYHIFNEKEVEIIGNIYENKDLLIK